MKLVLAALVATGALVAAFVPARPDQGAVISQGSEPVPNQASVTEVPRALRVPPAGSLASRPSPTPYEVGNAATPSLLLPFEKPLVFGNEIFLEQAVSQLSSDDFDRFVTRTLAQSKRDLEAARLTDFYGQSLRDHLDKTPGVQFKSVGCGLTLCIGSVMSYGQTGKEALSRFDRILSLDGDTPAYSIVEVTLGDAAAQELRFIFSLDPAVRGTGGPPPVTPP